MQVKVKSEFRSVEGSHEEDTHWSGLVSAPAALASKGLNHILQVIVPSDLIVANA